MSGGDIRPFRDRPRPVRCRSAIGPMEIQRLLGPAVSELAGQGMSLGNMLTPLLSAPGIGRLLAANMAFDQGPHGTLFLLAETLFLASPASSIFEVHSELATQLLATDFTHDQPIPARFCRLPVDQPIFIHVPAPPSALDVASAHDALPLSGYYLREAHAEGCRILEMIAVSCPPAGDTTCDADNYLFIDVPVVDEDEPLLPLFEKADRRARELAGQPDRPDLRSPVLPHLAFVAKLLVYLGMREARQTVHPERTEALAAAHRLGPRKREGALRRADRLHDYVRIAAPAAPSEDIHTGSAGHAPLPHSRRGHFRLARCGSGRLDRRLVWIRPTLVGRASSPPARHYRVS